MTQQISHETAMRVLFPKYEQLINNRCWYYAKKFAVDVSELQGEGYLIFADAIKSFNPEKSMFSTHLFTKLMRLKEICLRERKILDSLEYSDELNESPDLNSPQEYTRPALVEAIRTLDDDCKRMLECILYTDFNTNRRKPSMGAIRKYFRARGWDNFRIDKTYEQTKIWWNTYYAKAYGN